MRLLNYDVESIHNSKQVTLREATADLPAITLTVHALPPTWPEDVEAELPAPRPKRIGLSRGKKGQVDRDPDTSKPIILYDEDDLAYRKELVHVRMLQSVKMIVDALDSKEVAFDAQRDNLSADRYYEAVRGELVAMGFSVGDIAKLAKEIQEVSDLDEEDLEHATTDFFEADSPPSDTSSTPSS